MEKNLPAKGERINFYYPDGDESGVVTFVYEDGVDVLRDSNGKKLYVHWAHIINDTN
ncbi:hypothetical protein P4K96_04185 [Bacillus cereus]|nr:hypothetical protein [Bacillus cereus]